MPDDNDKGLDNHMTCVGYSVVDGDSLGFPCRCTVCNQYEYPCYVQRVLCWLITHASFQALLPLVPVVANLASTSFDSVRTRTVGRKLNHQRRVRGSHGSGLRRGHGARRARWHSRSLWTWRWWTLENKLLLRALCYTPKKSALRLGLSQRSYYLNGLGLIGIVLDRGNRWHLEKDLTLALADLKHLVGLYDVVLLLLRCNLGTQVTCCHWLLR